MRTKDLMRLCYSCENSGDTRVFYHISSILLEKLTPRVPNNRMTKEKGEESKTARISLSDTINGCLNGVGLSNKEMIDKEFYVYNFDIDVNSGKFVSNKEIIKKKLVFDAKQTGECWYLDDLVIKEYKKIKIVDISDKVVRGNKINVYDYKYL
jgi:repressor of nif and glnA expression